MALTDHLRTLEKAGLIRLAAVRPEPEFTFRHALVQQAVYQTYLKNQRRMVHQAIAEVLEQAQADQSHGDLLPSDLAYHYFEAAHWDKAMAFARQAGERAQARYAPHEALTHFTLALDAARQLEAPAPTDLLRARGQAHEVLGSFEPARADYQAALNQARAAGRWQDEWQLLLDLGFLWAARDYARTGEFYRRALALAQAMGDDATLAHSLNRLGNWHFNAGENLAALRCHRQALGTFKQLADQRGLADTFDLLGMVETVIGQLQQGQADYRQAIALFREQDNRLGLASCLSTLAEQGPGLYTDTVAYVMPAAEAIEYGRQSIQIAREAGARAAEAYGLNSLASIYVAIGDYATGLPMLADAWRIAEEIGHRQWQTFALSALSMASLDLLLPEQARTQIEPAYAMAREINSAIWQAGTTATLARVELELGRLSEAERLLVDRPAHDEAPSLHDRLFTLAQVELILAQGQPEGALNLIQGLITATPEWEPGQVVPRLWHVRGRIRAALGDLPAAVTDLQAACTTSLQRGTRPLVWRLRADLAGLYDRMELTAQAEAERAAARAMVASLVAGLPTAPWRASFLERAHQLIEGKDRSTP